jgi:hypothetical protein
MIDESDVPHVKTITIGKRVVENRLRFPVKVHRDTDPNKKPLFIIDVTEPPLMLDEDKVLVSESGQAMIREIDEHGEKGERYPHLIPVHRVRYTTASSNPDEGNTLPEEDSGRGFIVSLPFSHAFPGRTDLWGVNSGNSKPIESNGELIYPLHGAVLDPVKGNMMGTTGLIHFCKG